MAEDKLKGTFQFAANYEVTKADALDPRVRWDNWEQMIMKRNWPSKDNTIYIYKGLVAAVDDELWMLVDKDKFCGYLNTFGIQNSNDFPTGGTTRDIANYLGWKVVGNDVGINNHILTIQK